MQLSVILPTYREFSYLRLEHAVNSLRRQEGVQLEIVVAEANPQPGFASRSKELGVRYMFEPLTGTPSPGRVRNRALAAATGDLIYSTDADIVFPPDFMANLLALPARVWIHPPKRRLPKDQIDLFQARVEAQGLGKAMKELGHDPYFATVAGPIAYKLTQKEGRYYTCIQSDYAVWRSSPEMRDRAPAFWDSTRHRGGTLAPKTLWHEVGGYSEVYETWGYEDVDVQWKLEQKTPVGQIPDEDRFRLLHLDHDKTYFSPQHNAENKRRFQERKTDPTGVIAHDKVRFNATQS
jgi:glycosyltransferase involved in cell wall biosynthesis